MAYAADATQAFAPLAHRPGAVLLHSADRRTRFGRFDIMSAAPAETIAQDAQAPGPRGALPVDLSAQLAGHFGAPPAQSSPTPQAPFRYGFLGYLGYPLHQQLETHRPAPAAPDRLPPLWGGLYRWSLVTDHRQGTTTLHAADAAAADQGRALLSSSTPATPADSDQPGPFRSSMPAGHYRDAFERIAQYIRAGDCYQINFARHYQAPFGGDAWGLYQRWLKSQAAPFSAFLRVGPEQAVLSLSPERFVSRRGQRVTVSPIKGTVARRQRPERDALAQLSLLRSAKDRAENLMIVDLLRNDLGRLARQGSVMVTHLCEPVAFANVHHLVSTVEAALRPEQTTSELLGALFPCGSVTGAPKIRAMDIINELEPVGRSVYCGAVGYIDASGDCDFNVAIRTAAIDQGQVHLWGGGGIVADSQPAREREEIASKIGRLLGTR
jgi:para-aminobenzoate synthetase component 1